MKIAARTTFDLMDSVDCLDKCVDLVRAIAFTFNQALDVFPYPKDEIDQKVLNMFQVSANVMVDVVCDALRTTSDNTLEYCKAEGAAKKASD